MTTDARPPDARQPDAGPPDARVPDAERSEFLGEFSLTYYWTVRERDDGAERDVQLYTRTCEPLALVSRAFARRLAMEGAGRLLDDRTLNANGMAECDERGLAQTFFEATGAKRWGLGVAMRPLAPYRSVAVDLGTIPVGTVLYIPELDGLTMPGVEPHGGFVHDGCVVADDTGGNVGPEQIDFFVGRRAHYQALDRRHRLERIQVFDGTRRCAKTEHAEVARRDST